MYKIFKIAQNILNQIFHNLIWTIFFLNIFFIISQPVMIHLDKKLTKKIRDSTNLIFGSKKIYNMFLRQMNKWATKNLDAGIGI